MPNNCSSAANFRSGPEHRRGSAFGVHTQSINEDPASPNHVAPPNYADVALMWCFSIISSQTLCVLVFATCTCGCNALTVDRMISASTELHTKSIVGIHENNQGWYGVFAHSNRYPATPTDVPQSSGTLLFSMQLVVLEEGTCNRQTDPKNLL